MASERHDHNHNTNFPSTLQAVYRKLQNEHSNATSEIPLSHDGLHFLAARHALVNDFDTVRFRTSLASLLDVRGDFRLVQVVGDSGSAFSPSAIEKISAIVRGFLTSTSVLEYGYTAGDRDVNWVVNEIVSRDRDLAGRTVGNVVFESVRAVREWGCEATGHVMKFVLVYDEEGETRFGDDLFVSDGLMQGRHGDGDGGGDVMICVEGGVQSLEQICGVLKRGVSVVAVTGRLRDGGADVSASTSRFSAAWLMKKCVDALLDGRSPVKVVAELMDEMRGRGVFDQRPGLEERVERCLRKIIIERERLKDVKTILVD